MEKNTQKTVLQLYRTLYRLAKKFDREGNAKTLIFRHARGSSSSSSNAASVVPPTAPIAPPINTDTVASQYYNHILDQLLQSRNLYLPTASAPSFVSIVRSEFRSEVSTTAQTPTAVRIDVGFTLLRKFTVLIHGHSKLMELPVNPLDASQEHVVSTGQHQQVNFEVQRVHDQDLTFEEASSPTPGIILAAHPLLNGPLHRTVILLLEHNDKASYGVVINRPTAHTLSSAVKNLPQEVVSRFGNCTVAFGGMVRRMQLLHSVSNCGGIQIPFTTSPLFAGGLITRALGYTKRHPQDIHNFKFFVGCCCWEAGQLEEELRSGYWIMAKTQPDLLLKLAQARSASSVKSVSNEEETSPSQQTAAESIAKNNVPVVDVKKYRNGRAVEHSVDVYSLMLESMGEKYQHLIKIPHWLDSSMIESCDWKG